MRTEIATMMALGIDGAGAVSRKRPFWIPGKGLFIEVPNGFKTNDKGERRPAVKTHQIATEGNFNVNATLRKDEWVQVDLELLEAYRQRLVVFEAYRRKGLIQNLGGLGVLASEWENASAMIDASIDMDGESLGREDRQTFGLNGVPIPVIHSEFRIGERVLMASRMRGASLDVTQGIEAAQSVARTVEKMFINGSTMGAINSDGQTYQIYGLTNFPNRVQFTSLSDWSDPATTQETILTETLQMVQTLEEDERRFGPFAIWIPADCSFQFYEDYKSESEKTLMQRILDDPRIESIEVADELAAGNVIVAQLEKTTTDAAVGADESNIQWASGSGWTNHFQTFAALAPRFKTDADGRCGILHGTEGS